MKKLIAIGFPCFILGIVIGFYVSNASRLTSQKDEILGMTGHRLSLCITSLEKLRQNDINGGISDLERELEAILFTLHANLPPANVELVGLNKLMQRTIDYRNKYPNSAPSESDSIINDFLKSESWKK